MLCINSIYSHHVMEHCLIHLNVYGAVSYSLLLACFLVCVSGLFFGWETGGNLGVEFRILSWAESKLV